MSAAPSTMSAADFFVSVASIRKGTHVTFSATPWPTSDPR